MNRPRTTGKLCNTSGSAHELQYITCGCLSLRQDYCVYYNQSIKVCFSRILIDYLSMNINFATYANDMSCIVK